jgi:hypothetical protein
MKLALFFLIPLLADSAWLNLKYRYRIPIRIPAANVAGTQNDFPLLLRTTDVTHLAQRLDPTFPDISITDLSGTSALPYELEGLPMVSGNGVWTWFNDPRAIRVGSRTYIGWISRNGTVYIGLYDHLAGSFSTYALDFAFEADDHDNPSILILPSGKVAVFYSRHNGEAYYRITTTTDGSIGSWGSRIRFPESVNTNNTGDRQYSYMNPYLMADGKIIVFTRVLVVGSGYTSRFLICQNETDLAAGTWSPSYTYIAGPARPYVKIAQGAARTVLHLALTDDHPNANSTNSIYYMTFDGSTFRRIDGSTITTLSALPFSLSAADRVYNGASARAWIWDIALDAAERPVMVYAVFPGATNTSAPDHRYYWTKWNGTAWVGGEVARGGTSLYSSEPFYSGGIAIDPRNTNVVYYCSNYGRTSYWLEKAVTTNDGASWSTTVLRKDGMNIRPYVVRNSSEQDGFDVLWLTGRYTSYTDYQTQVSTLKRQNLSLPLWIKVPQISSLQDTVIFAYYGKRDAPTTQSTTVWSNYRFVSHVGGSDSADLSVWDSATAGSALKAPVAGSSGVGNITGITGVIHRGQQCGGGPSDYVSMPTATLNLSNTGAVSTEFWVNGSNGTIVSSWQTANYASIMARLSTGAFQCYVRMADGSMIGGSFSGLTFSSGVWNHVVCSYDATNGMRAWFNGVQSPTTFAAAGNLHGTAAPEWRMCSSPHGGTNLTGSVDEVRVSAAARDGNYALTSYRNQQNPAAFISLGSPQLHPVAAAAAALF